MLSSQQKVDASLSPPQVALRKYSADWVAVTVFSCAINVLMLTGPIFMLQVYVGQEVSIMFSAFNARTTPQLNGTVKSVSLNTSLNEEVGLAFYPVRVAISNDELKRLGEQPLISGMPIEAFFATKSRSPLNYLTKPLTDNIKRAGREE